MEGETIKVSLTPDNMITFFAQIKCCNETHFLMKDQLMELDEFACGVCFEPLALRSENGLWYVPGNRLFE